MELSRNRSLGSRFLLCTGENFQCINTKCTKFCTKCSSGVAFVTELHSILLCPFPSEQRKGSCLTISPNKWHFQKKKLGKVARLYTPLQLGKVARLYRVGARCHLIWGISKLDLPVIRHTFTSFIKGEMVCLGKLTALLILLCW